MGISSEESDTPRGRPSKDALKAVPDPTEGAVHQFVYKQRREEAFKKANLGGDMAFRLVSNPLGTLRLARPLLARFGIAGFAKSLAKTATKRRNLYLFITGNRVAHFGWLNIGFCNYYEIESGSVAIGPIWSDKSMRGRGLATEGLKRAMGGMLAKGHEVFYVDTSHDNIPAQRAIANAGFGEPIAKYIETPNGWKPLETEST